MGWKYLQGIIKESDQRYIYPILSYVDDYDRVDWDHVSPSSYKRDSTRRENHIKRRVCRVPRPLPPSLRGVADVKKFIENAKPYWVQAKDVRRMTHGETAQMVNFHRNTGDVIFSGGYKQHRLYTPAYLFKKLRIVYQHDTDLHGWIIADAEGKKKDLIPITWDILEKDRDYCMWRRIHKNESAAGKAYLGLRGPLIFWDDLKTLPRTYYNLYEGLIL